MDPNSFMVVDFGVVEIGDLDRAINAIRTYPDENDFTFHATSQVMQMTVEAAHKVSEQYQLSEEGYAKYGFGFEWGGIVGPAAADVQVIVRGYFHNSYHCYDDFMLVYRWTIGETVAEPPIDDLISKVEKIRESLLKMQANAQAMRENLESKPAVNLFGFTGDSKAAARDIGLATAAAMCRADGE